MESTEKVTDSAYYAGLNRLLEGIIKRISFFQIDQSAIEGIRADARHLRLLSAWWAIRPTNFKQENGSKRPNELDPQYLAIPNEFSKFWLSIEQIAAQREFPFNTELCSKLLEEAAYSTEVQGSWQYYHEVKDAINNQTRELSDLLISASVNPNRLWGLTGDKEGSKSILRSKENAALNFLYLYLNFHLRLSNPQATLLATEYFLVHQKEEEAELKALEHLKSQIRIKYREMIDWNNYSAVQRNLHNWYFDYGYAISGKVAPEWNERQLSIIRMLFQQRTITTRELYGRFSCNRKTIQRDFKELMDSGMVRQERQGSALRYALNLRNQEEFDAEVYNLTLPEAPELILEQPEASEKRKLRYGKRLAAKAALNMLQLSFDYSSSSLNR